MSVIHKTLHLCCVFVHLAKTAANKLFRGAFRSILDTLKQKNRSYHNDKVELQRQLNSYVEDLPEIPLEGSKGAAATMVNDIGIMRETFGNFSHTQ